MRSLALNTCWSSLTELHPRWRAAPGAASRPGWLLHSPNGPLHWPRWRARSPRLHVVLHGSVWRERPVNTLLSVVLTRDHQPTCSDHRHVLQLPACTAPVLLLSVFFFFFLNYVSGLIFIFIFYHCPHCPPPSTSSPLPHLLSPLYLLFTPYSSSPGLQRGRENFFLVFLFLFSCCNCFFFIKMNKVNIFYYTEQIRYFSSSDLKKRQNCNKENCYTFICYSLFTAGRMLWMNEHI